MEAELSTAAQIFLAIVGITFCISFFGIVSLLVAGVYGEAAEAAGGTLLVIAGVCLVLIVIFIVSHL